jgi:hypothetical protein
MRRAFSIALIAVALLGAACGNSGTTPAGRPGIGSAGFPTGEATAVTVGPQNEGQTVRLRIGDSLVFVARGTPIEVTSTPPEFLTLYSEPGQFPIRFRGHREGTGQVKVGVGPPCGNLGPATPGVRCPLQGQMSGYAGMPALLITINVVIAGHAPIP